MECQRYRAAACFNVRQGLGEAGGDVRQSSACPPAWRMAAAMSSALTLCRCGAGRSGAGGGPWSDSAARRRPVAVYCEASPGCRSVWYGPRCEPGPGQDKLSPTRQ